MLFKHVRDHGLWAIANFDIQTVGPHTHEDADENWPGEYHDSHGRKHGDPRYFEDEPIAGTKDGANIVLTDFQLGETKKARLNELVNSLAATHGKGGVTETRIDAMWTLVTSIDSEDTLLRMGDAPSLQWFLNKTGGNFWRDFETQVTASKVMSQETINSLLEAGKYGDTTVGENTFNALYEQARQIWIRDKPLQPDLKWEDVLTSLSGNRQYTTQVPVEGFGSEATEAVEVSVASEAIKRFAKPPIPKEAYEYYKDGVPEAFAQLNKAASERGAVGISEAEYQIIRGTLPNDESKKQLDSLVLRHEADPLGKNGPATQEATVTANAAGGGFRERDGEPDGPTTIFSGTSGTGGVTPLTEYQRLSLELAEGRLGVEEASQEWDEFMGNWTMENAEKMASFEREKFLYSREEDARKRRLTADIGELNAQVAVSRDTDQARLAAFPYALPDVPGNEYVPGFGPGGAAQTLGAFSGATIPTVSREQVVVPFDAGAIGRQAIEQFHASQGAA
jgi:hypothetical protein